MFTSPAANETVLAGDEIDIEAMLVDPVLDVMVTDIRDTTRKEREYEYTDENGENVTVQRYASLNPTVTITSAAGKQVASGEMPFG